MACGARSGLKLVLALQWHLGEERWREAHQGGQKKTAAMSDEREGWPRPVPERRRSELPSRPAAGCRYGCGWSDERARRPWASARPRDGRRNDRVGPQHGTTKGA